MATQVRLSAQELMSGIAQVAVHAVPDKVVASSCADAYAAFAPEQRPFMAHGENLAAFMYKGRDGLLEGPAGTGKSVTLLSKAFLLAEMFPGARCLLVRKTRASMTQSTLVTWEEKIVPVGHPCLLGPSRAVRTEYQFPNGSIVAIGGMDKPSRILSTEWDYIYVMEATELDEREWETLKLRLRNYKIPWQQVIGDCNPDAPDHWLNIRCDGNRTRRFVTRHEDNPAYYDWIKGEWTRQGLDYLETLDSLSGVLLDRFRFGRWVRAEGVVYPEYDAHRHLIPQFNVPNDWPSHWVIDFGYTHPFVWQEWREDNDGRMFRTREIYMTQRTVKEHCDVIAALPNLKRPTTVICDHDAGDRKVVEQELRVRTKAAIKDVQTGLGAVRDRLKLAGDGYARIYLCRDALVERDENLKPGIPFCTESEFGSYVWDKTQGQRTGEQPVKRYDHGMDGLRYLVMNFDRPKGKSFGFYSNKREAA